MQTIHMCDIYGQYLTIKDEIDEAIQEVIKSTRFIKSGKVLDFEAKLANYLHTHVISCGNGTDALQLAFMALELQPGDEVITTPFSFVSTIEVLVFLGLKPVFVDICPNTFNLDVSQIEKAITARTKAILPVHLFGQCANMQVILEIAKAHKLYVVEDACQALGADYIFADGEKKKAGTIGDIGCNSFFPSKNLGAFGDGGAVYTSNKTLADKIRSIANHGMKAKYEYQRVGINSRLDSIQAAILEVKLKYIDAHIKARQKAAAFYDEHLQEVTAIQIPLREEYSTHAFHQYTIQTESRDELKKYLESKGIPSMVYYPKALHLHEAYRSLAYRAGDFPVAEKLAKTVLSLPMHTELNDEQLTNIVKVVKQFYAKSINS